jgi:hypothetical protein
MIAQITVFSESKTLSEKIDYHLRKIEKGDGEFIYSSSFDDSLHKLQAEMINVSNLNDRVDQRFVEFSLNFVPEEILSDGKLVAVAQKYMQQMGYDYCPYGIIKHTDKDHLHVHILSTTVSYDGKHICSSHNYRRSQKIAREIEAKYGLQITRYDKFNSENLSKIRRRDYYYANALEKGLRDFSAKKEIETLIQQNLDDYKCFNDIKGKKLNNDFLESFLGQELYNDIGSILEKHNLFSSLYKKELLHKFDEIYSMAVSHQNFILKLKAEGYYVRLIRDAKKNRAFAYTYGIAGKYFRESSLPQKYQYKSLCKFKKETELISREEQQAIIMQAAILVLRRSNSVTMFIEQIKLLGIEVTEHTNSGGLFGLSFKIAGSDKNETFKASEVSHDRAFSFSNLAKHYQGQETNLDQYMNQPRVISDKPIAIEGQKQQIVDIVYQSMNLSDSFEDFRYLLSKQGISFWYRKSTNGDRDGFSFKVMGNHNARPFKASDLGRVFQKELEDHIQYLKKRDAENVIHRFSAFSGEMERSEQKEYIYQVALKGMADNPTLDVFKERMESSNIVVSDPKKGNASGKYIFRLKRADAVSINAKSISREFNQMLLANFGSGISSELHSQVKNAPTTYLPQSASSDERQPYLDIGTPSDTHSSEDDSEFELHRKKRRQKNNLNNQLEI